MNGDNEENKIEKVIDALGDIAKGTFKHNVTNVNAINGAAIGTAVTGNPVIGTIAGGAIGGYTGAKAADTVEKGFDDLKEKTTDFKEKYGEAISEKLVDINEGVFKHNVTNVSAINGAAIGTAVTGNPVIGTITGGAIGGYVGAKTADFINGINDTNDEKVRGRILDPGLKPGDGVSSNTNINMQYDLASKLSVKRKRYYIKYYDRGEILKGPYDANEARQLAINVFKMTPGQGIGAQALSILLQENIGCIRTVLEETLELSKDAICLNSLPLGYDDLNRILVDDLDKIVPTMYKKYANLALPTAVKIANEKQRESNHDKLKEVTRIRNEIVYRYIKTEQYLEKELESLKKNMEIVGNDINENLTNKYSYYLKGNEYTQSRPAKTSSLPREQGEIIGSKADVYLNVNNTNIIIDDLEIIENYIKECNQITEDQVNTINRIENYVSSCGLLKQTDVNEPLVKLSEDIQSLKRRFIYSKQTILQYSKGTSSSSGGSSKPTPPKTPTSTGYQTPDTTPSQTEPSTERPTVPVTTEPTTQGGGPLPSIPVGGNNNGNVNSNSNGNGNYYWGENNNGYSDSNSNSDASTAESTVATEPTFDIKEGNKFKLPTSTKPNTTTTTTTSQGSSVVPVLAGLAAAAAAGIGAKAYIDRKNNRDNESDEEFKSEDWSTNNDINIEYHDSTNNEIETLDFDDVQDDYEVEETEKYGARTHQDLEKLQ